MMSVSKVVSIWLVVLVLLGINIHIWSIPGELRNSSISVKIKWE